jgi:hypothetical protein
MTRRVLLSLFVALGSWVLTPGALAQQELPQEIVESPTTLSPDQQGKVDQYIADNLKTMSAAEPSAMKRGRDALLQPFSGRTRKASVAFRQYFGGKIAPELDRLAKGSDDKLAINALRVAGEIATPETASVLESALKDKRIAVQYAGACGTGRTFDAMIQFSPAIAQERALGIIGALGAVVGQEQNPDVLDASIRALSSATRIDRKGFEPVREAALTTLADQTSGRLKAMNVGAEADSVAPAILRALTTVRIAVAGNLPFSQAAYKKAAELGGHGVAYVARNVKALQDGPAKEVYRQIVNEAETLIQAATTKANGTYTPTNLASDFAQGASGERTFSSKFLQVMKALQGQPFNFPIGTFVAPGAPGAG